MDGNDIAQFAYDALGRRIRKTDSKDANNTKLYYYNNNWQVLYEASDSGSVTKSLLYGNYIDEVIFMRQNLAPRWFVNDHLYSPVALTNTSGTVLERYEYDAYGEPNILDADFSKDADGLSDYDNNYLFTGRRLDILDNGSLKIQYNRNRYYDYHTGRFTTHDPLGINPAGGQQNVFSTKGQYNDGLNLYEYAHSRPINLSDPLGLSVLSLTGLIDLYLRPPCGEATLAYTSHEVLNLKIKGLAGLIPKGLVEGIINGVIKTYTEDLPITKKLECKPKHCPYKCTYKRSFSVPLSIAPHVKHSSVLHSVEFDLWLKFVLHVLSGRCECAT